jgi:hypothetical protein
MTLQTKREEGRKRGPSILPRGFDAGKLIRGRKRHVLVDSRGLLVATAYVPDRDGGVGLVPTLLGLFPFLATVLADSACEGVIFGAALITTLPHLTTEIVKRSDRALSRCRSAGSSSAPDKGLGEPQPHGSRLPQASSDPTQAAKTLQSLTLSVAFEIDALNQAKSSA